MITYDEKDEGTTEKQNQVHAAVPRDVASSAAVPRRILPVPDSRERRSPYPPY